MQKFSSLSSNSSVTYTQRQMLETLTMIDRQAAPAFGFEPQVTEDMTVKDALTVIVQCCKIGKAGYEAVKKQLAEGASPQILDKAKALTKVTAIMREQNNAMKEDVVLSHQSVQRMSSKTKDSGVLVIELQAKCENLQTEVDRLRAAQSQNSEIDQLLRDQLKPASPAVMNSASMVELENTKAELRTVKIQLTESQQSLRRVLDSQEREHQTHLQSISTTENIANTALNNNQDVINGVLNGAQNMCQQFMSHLALTAKQAARESQAQLELKNQLLGALDSVSNQLQLQVQGQNNIMQVGTQVDAKLQIMTSLIKEKAQGIEALQKSILQLRDWTYGAVTMQEIRQEIDRVQAQIMPALNNPVLPAACSIEDLSIMVENDQAGLQMQQARGITDEVRGGLMVVQRDPVVINNRLNSLRLTQDTANSILSAQADPSSDSLAINPWRVLLRDFTADTINDERQALFSQLADFQQNDRSRYIFVPSISISDADTAASNLLAITSDPNANDAATNNQAASQSFQQ